MSTGKIVGIIAAVAVLVGGYWWWAQSSTPASEYAGTGMSTSSPSDTSDAAINQDTAAIDAQLSAAASDSATANSTTNDKPVTQ